MVILAPLESKTLRVAIAVGGVRDLIAEQTAGSAELYLSEAQAGNSAGSDATPYANGSGLHAKIQVLLSAGQQGPLSSTRPRTSLRPSC